MEYLSRNLNALKENNEFKYHPICAKLGITHLSFADDLLLFARGDLPSVTLIQQCFSEFSTTSSLQENMDKSSVYFGGMAQKEREQILHKLGFGQGELPFKYLGIPLSTKKLSLMQWQPLIDKMVPRISNWTSKKLSYARRIQLVKTVMFGIQAYWAQFFLIPAKIMKAIEEYYRSYIWSVAKNYWDLTHKQDTMWIKWVHVFYIKGQQIDQMAIPKQSSWMLRKIFEARETVQLNQITVKAWSSMVR
uniref:Reverse transcriptase domain-containing protein n=1 Tax=Nicotiana tabacum TaxID=4097 RepID=A0A1S3XJH3_TOBAC|nr:PREDICTED: uncharacterized protein LOC107765875 [Nicotiana tabacum]